MWLREPLDDVLSSRAKVAALRVVCSSPVPLSGREIARRAAISSSSASRVLAELAASGVVVSRDQGRVNTYELGDTGIPLVGRLRDLFSEEAGRSREALDDLLRGIPDVQSVILFGSEARGEARSDSDVDLLIVVEDNDDAARRLLEDNALYVAQRHMLPLSWVLVDLGELKEWDEGPSPLWTSILAEGICLRGTPAGGLTRRWRPGATG